MRKLAVLESFFRPHHREAVDTVAARCGFSVDYYPAFGLPAERAGEYEVIYGLPRTDVLQHATALKWFASGSSGVDHYSPDELYADPEHIMLTNSAGAYGTTISEHMVMVTLMLLRNMMPILESNRDHHWRAQQPQGTIFGSTVTMLGVGDIGTSFARRIKAMGASHIYGVRRSTKDADPAFDEMGTFADLPRLLPKTDILALALPSTPETYHILNEEMLSLLPPHAVVINVGRGRSIDENALRQALVEGRIAGAALDVFVTEPLPEDSPLWETPNLLITPHVSGNMTAAVTQDKQVEMFCRNLERYAAGEPLHNLVDRKRMY